MNRMLGRIAVAFAMGAAVLAAPATATAQVGAAALATCTHKWDYQPARANRSKNCVLGRGNYGSGVMALQESLKYCYNKNIAIDRNFGPATERALIQVQRQVGARADGVYGPETNRKMKWLAATGCRHNPSGD